MNKDNDNIIDIYLDKKCIRCGGEDGATQSGLCLKCVIKGLKRGDYDHIIKKVKRDVGL